MCSQSCGAPAAASGPVFNFATAPDNDHGWLQNKIIAYYTNPTIIGTSQFALNLTVSGSGTVDSSPTGIECSSSCSANFTAARK